MTKSFTIFFALEPLFPAIPPFTRKDLFALKNVIRGCFEIPLCYQSFHQRNAPPVIKKRC